MSKARDEIGGRKMGNAMREETARKEGHERGWEKREKEINLEKSTDQKEMKE